VKWTVTVWYIYLLHKFASSLSKLHGVTCYKTVTFTVNVLSFITLHNAKSAWMWREAYEYCNLILGIATQNQIRILILDCKILRTVANLQTYDVCQCSCLSWIYRGSVCWSCKPLTNGAVQINRMEYYFIIIYWTMKRFFDIL
jgi:hypothetical protein